MATDIGIIKTLIGTATATAPDGLQRTLKVGDRVSQDELISTGVLGAIEIEFNDGSIMTLGRNSQVMLNDETFNFAESQQAESLQTSENADVESIQQAILDGDDPTQTTPATAAGAGVESSNEGIDFVQVNYEKPEMIPEAGFDTTGISFAFEEEFIDDGASSDGSLQGTTTVVPPVNVAPQVVSLDSQTLEDTTVTFTVADLLSGATDQNQTDTLSIKNVTLASGDGELVDNGNGTWSYTPAPNSDNDAIVNFDVTDGIASVANTMSIEVVAVADSPNLLASVRKAFQNSSEQTIDIFNVSDVDKGFTVKAFGLDGNEALISERLNSRQRGFGVDGNSSGAAEELGSTTTASERIEVQFENVVDSIEVSFAWLHRIETAEYTFYLDGVAVGQGTTDGITDTIDGPFTLFPDSGSQFDRVDFTAPLNRTDDYLINSITFERVESYSYELTVESGLTDLDGSEILGAVDISSLPAGVTFDGTYLVSSSPLTDSQINQITASVTSTEATNGDQATTTVTAKLEFGALDASAESGDVLIKATAASENIIGGAGDDVIFGGAGNDVISGGAGADQFVWNDADVGVAGAPAVDVINDFNAAEGDVLNLSDLLSDSTENNSITGLEHNGHLELQISNGNNVIQKIDITSIAVANDAAAVDQLNTMLANGTINDGI
jgi:Ca2+-binding RTX toxin-like protein